MEDFLALAWKTELHSEHVAIFKVFLALAWKTSQCTSERHSELLAVFLAWKTALEDSTMNFIVNLLQFFLKSS